MGDSERRGVWRDEGVPLWADKYPDVSRAPIPIDYLHEQSYFELERDKIFRKCWLYVGRIEEFPSPQGYLVKEVQICKASVLITKDDRTGKLSAFHNICKHRLNKLVYDTSGTGGSFVCNYHAWAYDRTGHLRHVPEEGAFFDFNKRNCDLAQVSVDVWRGFIFINLDPNPEETLLEYLGEIPEMLADYPFERLTTTCAAVQGEMNVNWKVGQQTNMETYHAYRLHVDRMLGGGDRFQHGAGSSPLNVTLMKRHRHFAYGFRQDGDMGSAPPTMKMAAEMSDASALNALPSDTNLMADSKRKYPGTNHNDQEYWAGDNYFIFPNLLLHTGPEMVQTLIYEPLTVTTSLCKNTFFFPEVKSIEQAFAARLFVSTQLNVLCNDMWAGERVQDGLETGAASEMVLMDSEICILHEYDVYKSMIEA